MRFVVLAAALAAVFAAATPAAAQAPSRKQTTVVYTTLTAADVDALLSSEGYTDVQRISDKQVNVTAPDGFRFVLNQAVCEAEGEAEGCLGLSISATWSLKAGDQAVLRPTIDLFNATYPLAKAMVFEDHVLLERYVITDGGVSLAHVAQEIAEYLSLTEVFENSLAQALE